MPPLLLTRPIYLFAKQTNQRNYLPQGSPITMRTLCTFIFICATFALFSQTASLRGTVNDSQNSPISFANITVYDLGNETPLKGTTSDDKGNYFLDSLEEKGYDLRFSFIGYESVRKTFTISAEENILNITLNQGTEPLDETVVVAKKPTIKKEPGKLIFTVENSSLSTGSTLNLLSKTPGVAVIQNNITIKNTTPVIFINEKRVYLSSSEVASLLSNVDASSIKSIEVITNPSAKYEAEAGTVLNIITSKAISIGYKGSVNGRWEQAVFPKYNLGTSHYYKNNWINFYGSYSISPRKEHKDQEGFIRFFNPNGGDKSIWKSDFNRITKSQAHQGNMLADIIINDNHALNVSANVLISPDKTFRNTVNTEIFDSQRKLDSIFSTRSALENDTSNLSFGIEHQWSLGNKGVSVETGASYILYNNTQMQDVATQYSLPAGDVLWNNNFFTDSFQETDIFTAQMDVTLPLGEHSLETGVKFSKINTDSGLDFYDGNLENSVLNAELSDSFLYEETIFAGYFNWSKEWIDWQLEAGVRGEYTDVNGDSKSLGLVNTQNYFEVFPSAAIEYTIDEDNSVGISYARRLQRPRYQSLNPFKYFLNENNFNGGNPNLTPAFENKITLNYNYKNTWFIELYYQKFNNALSILTFQDNENNTLRNIDANLISDFQYSLDLVYASSVKSWWYLSVVTSTFYLENEFFSEASNETRSSNDTFGFYGQMYSGLTLSEKASLTADLTAVYLSNLIYGSYDYKNQLNCSISFRKSLWGKRASISAGVDDVFNTWNVPVTSSYYNQDNSYFAMPESRLFRLGFRYYFGNARLRDNNRTTTTDEGNRLN